MDHASTRSQSFIVKSSGLPFILILSALMAITSLSTDIYLPAMPLMAQELHGDAELTITGFLIGFCIAQLIWGPLSDHFGRKVPLFIGLVLFVIGSVGCALSSDITQNVFWRVFQALGACTGPMLARAMIRDLFARTRAAQMLSTLMVVMAIAPIAGPLLGGQADDQSHLVAHDFLAAGGHRLRHADTDVLVARNLTGGQADKSVARRCV